MPDIPAAERALAALWNKRTEFKMSDGSSLVGFATIREHGDRPPIYANESGTVCPEPLIDYQAREGTPGVILTLLRAFKATGNKLWLEHAATLVDSTEGVLYHVDGENDDTRITPGGFIPPVWGVPQDVAIVDDELRAVSVWGGARRLEAENGQLFATLDDKTTQSVAMALYEFGLVSGEAGGEWTGFLRALRSSWYWGTAGNDGLPPIWSGVVPQQLPLSRALSTSMNDNDGVTKHGYKSPDGPGYMAAMTLQDWCAASTLICAIRFGDHVVANAILCRLLAIQEVARGLFPAQTGLDNRARWAREAEPGTIDGESVILTGETGLPHALAYATLLGDAAGRLMARTIYERYMRTLHELPQPPNASPDRLYRNYVWSGGKWQPVFAKNYEARIGVENANWTGLAQQWIIASDRGFLQRHATDREKLMTQLAAEAPDKVIGMFPNKRPPAPAADGLWPDPNSTISIAKQCLNILGLLL